MYNIAKGMGILRQGKEDSRFPIKHMPMGLVEYTAQFFAFDNLQQVKRIYKRIYRILLFIRGEKISRFSDYFVTAKVFR